MLITDEEDTHAAVDILDFHAHRVMYARPVVERTSNKLAKFCRLKTEPTDAKQPGRRDTASFDL